MKTLRKVTITPVFLEGETHIPPFDEMKEGHIYISEFFNTSTHRCLCGCGEKTVLPLNRKPGENWGWDLIKENNGTISFKPSVGNFNYPCKSHYIITKNVANFV